MTPAQSCFAEMVALRRPDLDWRELASDREIEMNYQAGGESLISLALSRTKNFDAGWRKP